MAWWSLAAGDEPAASAMTSCSNSEPVERLGYGYHIIPVCPYVDTQLILFPFPPAGRSGKFYEERGISKTPKITGSHVA
jgi:hypothetical protein